MVAALGSGCGAAGSETAGDDPAVEEAAPSLTAASAGEYTGALGCSSDDLSVGVPFTVTQSATNVTGAMVGPIVLGVRRLGFAVAAVVKPRTGICRIAGSATCSSVVLDPGETQTYTLTLVPLGAGPHSITGWASSSYVAGGAMQSISFTVK